MLLRNRDLNMTQTEHVYANSCRPEVAGDVISGENIKTTEVYALLNVEAASIRCFRENQNEPIAQCVDDDRPICAPIFWVKEQKCLVCCKRKIEALESRFPKL